MSRLAPEGARGEAAPPWLLLAAALGALGAFLLVALDVSVWHPGYAYGDERDVLAWIQHQREGAPLIWQFSRGCFSMSAVKAFVALNGTDLASLHTPQLLSLALEWLFLALVARRWFGEEAAAWALLALCVSAQTWLRARSLLAFQFLPMETLALALAAGRVQGRPAALAWGLAAGLLFYEYDGAFIAVPGVWLACVALDPGFRRQARWSMAALALAGVLLLAQDHGLLQRYLAVRLGTSGAQAPGSVLSKGLARLEGLAFGGACQPYLGICFWPAWPWWTWAGLALGAWGLLRTRGAALLAWAAAGVLLTQAVASPYGPPVHRLVAMAPALALLSGVGLARLRQGLGSKAWLLALLLAAGALSEGWAWWRHQAAFAPELYARCESLRQVRQDWSVRLQDPSLRLVTQLSGRTEADARFVLDRPLGTGGPPPSHVLALLPGDYAEALGPDKAQARWYVGAKGFEPELALELGGPAAARLAAVEDAVAPLVVYGQDDNRAREEAARAWLEAQPAKPVPIDAWAWTAALEADAEAGTRTGGWDDEDQRLLQSRPLACAAPWMVLARASCAADPRLSMAQSGQALAVDPTNGEALLIQAACLRTLGDPRAEQASAAWVRLRDAGLSWRHTQ